MPGIARVYGLAVVLLTTEPALVNWTPATPLSRTAGVAVLLLINVPPFNAIGSFTVTPARSSVADGCPPAGCTAVVPTTWPGTIAPPKPKALLWAAVSAPPLTVVFLVYRLAPPSVQVLLLDLTSVTTPPAVPLSMTPAIWLPAEVPPRFSVATFGLSPIFSVLVTLPSEIVAVVGLRMNVLEPPLFLRVVVPLTAIDGLPPATLPPAATVSIPVPSCDPPQKVNVPSVCWMPGLPNVATFESRVPLMLEKFGNRLLPNVRFTALMLVSVARSSVPLPLAACVILAFKPAVPSAPAFAATSVPSSTVTPPVRVFTPERICVPGPALMKAVRALAFPFWSWPAKV